MNYAIEQRMRFIDFILTTFGYINRSMICDYYGLSIQQASHDIQDYLKLNGENVFYNKNTKKYMTTNDFVAYYK